MSRCFLTPAAKAFVFCLVCGGSVACAETIGTFASGTDPWQFDGGWEIPGASGGIERSTNQVREGQGALLLRGDFSKGGYYVGAKRRLERQVSADTLRFAVFSPTLGHLMIRATDFTGQVHQQQVDLTPSNAWQMVRVHPLAGGQRSGHFGGAVNDGQWHSPMRAVFIGFDKKALPSGQAAGEVLIDQVEVLSVAASPPPAPADAVSIVLERKTRVDQGLCAGWGPHGQAVRTEKLGKECWVTDRLGRCTQLTFNVDDQLLFGNVGPVLITVTYLDEGQEPVVVEVADGSGRIVEAGRLLRENTQLWRTRTLDVERMSLANAVDGDDLRLGIRAEDVAVSFVRLERKGGAP